LSYRKWFSLLGIQVWGLLSLPCSFTTYRARSARCFAVIVLFVFFCPFVCLRIFSSAVVQYIVSYTYSAVLVRSTRLCLFVCLSIRLSVCHSIAIVLPTVSRKTLVFARLGSSQNSKGLTPIEDVMVSTSSCVLAFQPPYLQSGDKYRTKAAIDQQKSCMRAFDWYRNQWPTMALNGLYALYYSMHVFFGANRLLRRLRCRIFSSASSRRRKKTFRLSRLSRQKYIRL